MIIYNLPPTKKPQTVKHIQVTNGEENLEKRLFTFTGYLLTNAYSLLRLNVLLQLCFTFLEFEDIIG